MDSGLCEMAASYWVYLSLVGKGLTGQNCFSLKGSSNQNGQASQRKTSDDDRGSLQN